MAEAPGRDGLEVAEVAEPEALRAEWDALALASGNPFLTPEWCNTWLERAPQGEPRIFAARDADGTVAAIAPLAMVRGRTFRTARFLGFQGGTQLGVVAPAGDHELAAETVRGALAALGRSWDVFFGQNLPGAGWGALLAAETVRRRSTPVARGPWENFLASKSRNLRSELGRKERRLQERGLRYRTVAAPGELDRALDELFELHRKRWGTSPFESKEAVHRAFAATALERGWLRLRFLELDGTPAAASLSYRFGEAEWSYQYGRDPIYEADSVGFLMTAHAMREAFEEGAAVFQHGPGGQRYKVRLSTEDPGLESVVAVRGLRGRAWRLVDRLRS